MGNQLPKMPSQSQLDHQVRNALLIINSIPLGFTFSTNIIYKYLPKGNNILQNFLKVLAVNSSLYSIAFGLFQYNPDLIHKGIHEILMGCNGIVFTFLFGLIALMHQKIVKIFFDEDKAVKRIFHASWSIPSLLTIMSLTIPLDGVRATIEKYTGINNVKLFNAGAGALMTADAGLLLHIAYKVATRKIPGAKVMNAPKKRTWKPLAIFKKTMMIGLVSLIILNAGAFGFYPAAQDFEDYSFGTLAKASAPITFMTLVNLILLLANGDVYEMIGKKYRHLKRIWNAEREISTIASSVRMTQLSQRRVIEV